MEAGEAGEAVTWQLLHGDARHVSDLVEPASVDAIITSPPYFALRSYRDGGEHYDGQIGSEPTPTAFLDALIECTRDWLTVLRPGGSIFVNLGDKYCAGTSAGRPGPSPARLAGLATGQAWHSTDRRLSAAEAGVPAKSLMGLPWRYAIRCIDELGLILRAEIVWSKPNGLPESVTDRVRRSHEQWFHFTVNPRYYAGIDEIREPHTGGAHFGRNDGKAPPGGKLDRAVAAGERGGNYGGTNPDLFNPLGKLPGSVWTIPSEPLTVPAELAVDHFAAYPTEWPRRLILGWTPTGYCTGCDEPLRAVVEKTKDVYYGEGRFRSGARQMADGAIETGWAQDEKWTTTATIRGYACSCPEIADRAVPEPTAKETSPRPAVVLDPFCGTGTTVAVAHHLGRHGIGIDLSRDYLRLAEWRCTSDEALRAKVLDRSGIPRPQPPAIAGQTNLFGDDAA